MDKLLPRAAKAPQAQTLLPAVLTLLSLFCQNAMGAFNGIRNLVSQGQVTRGAVKTVLRRQPPAQPMPLEQFLAEVRLAERETGQEIPATFADLDSLVPEAALYAEVPRHDRRSIDPNAEWRSPRFVLDTQRVLEGAVECRQAALV